MSSASSLKMKFNLDKMFAKVEGLEQAVANGLRPAAQAGAQVFYDEAKIRAAKKVKGGVPNSKSTGLLVRSIYQKYMKDESVEGKRAIYKISWRTGGKKDKDGAGPPLPFAPHGHLIEFGWVQRYAVYTDKAGMWHTAIRSEMQGKPYPKGGAENQAARDAYFVPRPGGPVHWMPKSFIRGSYEAKRKEALAAVKARMIEEIKKALV